MDVRLRRALPLAACRSALRHPAVGGAGRRPSRQPRISQSKAIEIAKLDPKAVAEAEKHPNLAPSASRNSSTGLWEVGFFTGDNEVVQVVVDPNTGKVVESWTGYQVAWRWRGATPGPSAG